MYKTEFIKRFAEIHGCSVRYAKEIVHKFIFLMEESLFEKDIVQFTGFGTFSVIKMKSKKCHNPIVKRLVEIPAHYKVKFIAGKHLKKTMQAKGK